MTGWRKRQVLDMAREAGFVEYELEDYTQSGYDIRYERFAELVRADEREACQALQQHEDVLAPVGNSAWGEAYQEGWAEGTAAYLEAIRARGQA